MLNFKAYLTETTSDDVETSKIRGGGKNKEANLDTPPETVIPSNLKIHTNLANLHKDILSLYPNLDNQINGYKFYTPFFASPEQLETFKDADDITNLYLSKRNNPYLHKILRPIASLFRQFLMEYMKTYTSSSPIKENIELSLRLEIKNFQTIVKNVENLKETLDRLEGLESLKRAFNAFYEQFDLRKNEIDRLLHKNYLNVKDLKWDKTPALPAKRAHQPFDPETDIISAND
jgi:hypothetical protein